MAYSMRDNMCKRKSQVSQSIHSFQHMKLQIFLDAVLTGRHLWGARTPIYWILANEKLLDCLWKASLSCCKFLLIALFTKRGAFFARTQNCFLWGATNADSEELRQELTYRLLWVRANPLALHVLKLLPNRCCLMVTGMCCDRSAMTCGHEVPLWFPQWEK